MKTRFTWLTCIAVLLVGLGSFVISSCNKEDPNAIVQYVGKVVYAQTTTPFPDCLVQVTDGSNIHCQGKTDGEGSFALTVRVDEINDRYYFLAGDVTCVPKQVALFGFGQSRVDLGTIEVEGPALPVVTTKAISNITAESANCGGNVVSDGRLDVTARGVCWSRTEEPTLDDDYTTNGTGKGEFQSKLTHLERGATYYVRAYATNAKGTAYGEQITFTTNTGLPQIVIDSIFDKTSSSAQCSANVISDGGYAITARGICWSDISASPTINHQHTDEIATTGKITSMMIGLLASHTYYVRAYAVNEKGIGYSETVKFTTTDGKPIVETGNVSNVTATSAMVEANVISQGDSPLTECGVCWSSTTSSPSITDEHTEEVARVGEFTSKMINLIGMTTYYVRAYATNANGTVYGNTVSFFTAATADGLPIVETLDPGENITTNSISTGGNVTNDGGFPVIEHGVVYSTLPYPTLDNASKVAAGSGMGYYSATITGITPATKTYYIRAYATNANGTAYGDQVVVTPERSEYITLKTMVYGGYTYRIKFIGEMSWTEGNTACSNMVYGGYSDWFMPDNGEVQAIITAYGLWNKGVSGSTGYSQLFMDGCSTIWTSSSSSSSYATCYYIEDIGSSSTWLWTWASTSTEDKLNINGVYAVRKYRAENQ